MPYHRVEQGECIASIAEDHGFFADDVWGRPENAKLRSLRGSPNVLLPGDVVFIPEKRLRKVPCATGKRHRFRRLGVPVRLRVQLVDAQGPRAHLAYRLSVGGTAMSGRTDGEGYIDVWVRPADSTGKLVLVSADGREEEYRLAIGHLDPVSEPSGLSARLRNLGFFAGRTGHESAADLTAALRRFQDSRGLPATGEPDTATRDALVAAHGS